MPELPEVETVKNFLDIHLLNKKIKFAKILNKKLRYEIPSKISKIIVGCRITKIIRRGKYLIFLLNNNYATLIHLGMTGCFRVSSDKLQRKHDHFAVTLENNRIIFNDVRKFGFIKLYKTDEIYNCSHLKNIGPEPLSEDFTFQSFIEKKKKRFQLKVF